MDAQASYVKPMARTPIGLTIIDQDMTAMRILVFLLALLVASESTLAEESAVMEIGGPRKVTARVTEIDDAYEIEVSLIPVRCFDSAMNRQFSREKGRSYALEALVRHLGGGKRQAATISNTEIVNARNVDTRFVLILRVPRKCVRLTEVKDNTGTDSLPDSNVPQTLLKAKDDYLETLKLVQKSLAESVPSPSDDLDEFYSKVDHAEDIGVTRLKSLRHEIKADRWLLALEREQLLRAVAEQEKLFLLSLRQALEEVEGKKKGDERRGDQ